MRLLEMSLRDQYDLVDVVKLDELVVAHHRAFLAVRSRRVLHPVLHAMLHNSH